MNTFNAGEWVSQGSYRSFQPMPIDRQWVVADMEVQQLLALGRRIDRVDVGQLQLSGRLDGLSEEMRQRFRAVHDRLALLA